MPSRYQIFDRSRLLLEPLASREHDLALRSILPLSPVLVEDHTLRQVAKKICAARAANSAVILMMGAHVLRSGVQRYLIDLLERGLISCLAMNGAGIIHDFEFSLIGATTESVARYIRDGRFGFWRETGRINEVIADAADLGLGLGEAMGREIMTGDYPHAEISLVAAAYRLGVPVTVHVGIGQDIIHQHSNCAAAALGEASYRDFLILAKVMERLEGGVVMNFGSAVMAPEVYLKALSMVRNVARQEGREVRRFATLVCDLAELPEDCRREPCRSEAGYFFRPWKTMLARTVADGGESFYVRGRHSATIPQLWNAVVGEGRE